MASSRNLGDSDADKGLAVERAEEEDVVPDTDWVTFRRQHEVLTFVRDGGTLLPFSYESQDGGRWRFLATRPEILWNYLSRKPPQERCYYEIIRESAPCKLYFDLEYSVPLNPNRDGPRMVTLFAKLVIFFLEQVFGVRCDERDIVNMDSTTQIKFSRHLIFVLPGAMFHDNYNVGSFVEFVCRQARVSAAHSAPLGDLSADDLASMSIVDSTGETRLFCDEDVYSMNRHFRMYRSTKYGKNSHLELAPDSKFDKAGNDLEVFLHSLITHFVGGTADLRVLRYPNTSS